MSLTDQALFAALSAGAYQPNTADQPLSLQSIADASGQPLRPSSVLPEPALNSIGLAGANNDTGMVYSTNGDGFAAQILQNGSQYIIVVRGTDMGGTTDQGDSNADINLALGTPNASQLTELKSIIGALQAQGVDTGDMTLAGQSLGGGLALLAGATLGIKTYAYDPAPFGAQLWVEATTAAANSAGIAAALVQAAADWADQDVGSSLYWQSADVQNQWLAGYIGQTAANTFTNDETALYNGYLANLGNTGLINASHVAGEILSSSQSWLGWGISLGATSFDSTALGNPLGGALSSPPLTIVSYDVGTLTNSDAEAVALHNPALMALVTKDDDFGTRGVCRA